MSKTIWLVDENENQSKTYARQIRRLVPNAIRVEQVFPPFRDMNKYVELLADPDTVCIVLDQKLKDTGIATYTGIELAQYLRGINSKLPIYILTNYPPDLQEGELRQEYITGEWSVEDIVDKQIFNNESAKETFRARLLRRLEIHEEVMTAHIARFKELLEKKVSGQLNSLEEQEFKKLQFERIAPDEARYMPIYDDLDEIINLNRNVLDSLKKLSQESGNE